jgi:hypothetical protein
MSTNSTRSDEERIGEVRRSAEELARSLEVAENATGQWTNQLLADALVDQAMARCLHRLSQLNCFGRNNQVLSGELWRVAGERLEVGVLQQRARSKPLGYAGDYLMLDWIIRWQCCEHPLGRFFDRYFQRQAAPEAVRARTLLAAGAIAGDFLASASKDFHVASVGVGPGADLAQAAEMLSSGQRDGLRFTLLDLDEAGLEFAAGQVCQHVELDQVTTCRENLFRLPRNRNAAERLAGANFILCTGLFDYLEDEAATALLSMFWQSLSPGGRMLVGNFAPHCPTRAYMEWVGNWYLNYRTAEGLAALAEAAGVLQGHFTIRAERLGIDWFIDARK